MWIIKIIIPYKEESFFARLSKTFDVAMVGYPVANQIRDDCVIVTISGFFQGEEKNIKDMIKESKKDKRMINIETNGNFVITQVRQHILNKYLFSPGIFHLKPTIVTKNGEYIFELGSFDKESLSQIAKAYTGYFNAKIEYFKEKKINAVQTINVYPNLTNKQKKCLDIAIKNNYYDYPRKITQKELAKIAKISYSTYQFHLQNAEKKVMPFLNSMI